MMFFGFSLRVDRLVETSASEKRAVSIFRAEMMSWVSEEICRVVGDEV
jgi:hypothetical protein